MKSRYVLPVVALSAVILSSCGGGGGGSGPVTGGGTPGTGEGAGSGLPPSVAAWNPWPRDTVELVDWRSRKGYRITNVAPSGADGLRVTYMAGRRERSIDLERSDDHAGIFSRESGDTLVVLELVDDGFDHFDTGSVFVNADGELSEGYVVFGSRTPAAGLPSGTATYRGKVTAERQYDPSGADPESTHPYSNDVEGDLTLTADLDGGSVQGVIDRISVRGYYASDFEPVFGARFEIDNGRIEGDAFVADLEGSGAFAGGYTGNVHGVFYGPAAEETGGVLGATRGENDVLIGHFGARPAPDGPGDGGGGAPDPEAPSIEALGEVLFDNRDGMLAAAEHMAGSRPNFGSVTQSTNRDAFGVTTDRARTTYDGRTLSVKVERADGGSLSFSAAVRPGTRVLLPTAKRDSLTVALLSVDWADADRTDYRAGGTWIHLSGDPATHDYTDVELGSFADGPEFSALGPVELPVAGTALYRGKASGHYGINFGDGFEDIPPGSYESGTFSGTAELTAHFHPDGDTMSGCLNCDGRATLDGEYVEVQVVSGVEVLAETAFEGRPAPFAMKFYPSPIDGSGAFSGNVTAIGDDPQVFEVAPEWREFEINGTWGGALSRTMNQNGVPAGVAGTFGAVGRHGGGTVGGFAGSYYGSNYAWAED